MAVVAGAAASGAHLRDVLALVHLVAHADQQAGVVAVVGDVAVLVVDLHQVAVAAHPPGVDHLAAVGGHDVGAVAVGDVDAAVVGGAAEDVAVAVVGGDGAAGGPAEGAGGRPGGPLLGAPGLDLGDGLGDDSLLLDDPLHLLVALVGDPGHGVGGAGHTGADNGGVALPHGVVVHVLDLVGDLRHVVLHLGGHDGQVGHGVADEQHVAGPQLVDVIAGVELEQLGAGHVVVLGNDGPAVPLLHGVGDLPGLGGVEQQRHVRQIGEILHRQVALPDLNVLHKVDGHGVLVAEGGGHLLQQLLQSPLGLGGADELAAHIQGVAVGHHVQLILQGLLQLPGVLHRAAGGEAGGVGHGALLQGVVVAQHVGDGGLHGHPGGGGLLLGGHGAQLHAVEGHGGGGGVENVEDGEHRHSDAGGEEHRHVEPLRLRHPPQPRGGGGQGGAQAVKGRRAFMPDQGHAAGQKETELLVGAAALGKPLPVPEAGYPPPAPVFCGHGTLPPEITNRIKE